MKKSLLFVLSGIAVFLAVMFVFIACETGTGSSETEPEDPPPPPSNSIPGQTNPAVVAAEELADTLEDLGVEFTRSGTTVTLKEPLELSASLPVPEGTTFAVAAGATLTVTQGTAYGGKGTIKIEAGATLVDNNKRTADTASYTFGSLQGPLEITVGGEYKVNASTTGTAEIRTLVGKDDTAFLKVGAGDKVTIDGDSRTITIAEGDVDLTSPKYGSSPTKKTLALFEGETLKIAKGATLTLTGEDSNLDLTRGDVANGGNVVIDGTLVLKGGQLEAYKIFESGNKSTGKIEVYDGGRILQIGQRQSGKHLIVEHERDFKITVTGDGSSVVKVLADITLYGWTGSATDSDRFTIDFAKKTITLPSNAAAITDNVSTTIDTTSYSHKGTLKTIGLNDEEDTPTPWKIIP
jgi:hypothetical protein